MYDRDLFTPLLNRPLAGIEITRDKLNVDFRFIDGSVVNYCSTSLIERVDYPVNGLVGLVISDFVTDSEDRQDPARKVYVTRLITAKGEIVLEYRNNANGYYDGWLERVQ